MVRESMSIGAAQSEPVRIRHKTQCRGRQTKPCIYIQSPLTSILFCLLAALCCDSSPWSSCCHLPPLCFHPAALLPLLTFRHEPGNIQLSVIGCESDSWFTEGLDCTSESALKGRCDSRLLPDRIISWQGQHMIDKASFGHVINDNVNVLLADVIDLSLPMWMMRAW